MSVQELAAFLGISVNTVYREYRHWAYKIGEHLRFKESEALAWLASKKAPRG